ncbi:hypothetical protein JQK62_23025, partial [Leptospira santarosai]|nr:hypothetical protein [Leptospira santarosai]
MVQKILTDKELLLNQLLEKFNGDALAPLLRSHEKWMKKNPEATDAQWSQAMVLESLSHLD